MNDKIVTFSCINDVIIYEDGCGLIPRPPYRKHKSIHHAIEHLNQRGVKSPGKVVIPKIED